jgi:hypothetical protein
MGDPELVARAQRAAVRLERSWDRWRRLHGLAAEQAQPVSSYVGYSLAEPWGRPRVVFGLGAEEAEQLAVLLEQDNSADPRFSQGLLWEPEPQTRLAQATVNGAQTAETAAASSGNSGQAEQQAEQAPADAETAAEWAQARVSRQQAAPADAAQTPDRDVPQSVDADLATWTSGELPGQASAGLAPWPPAGTPAGIPVGTTAPGDAERTVARQEPVPSARREAPARVLDAESGTAEAAAWLRLA